MISITQLAEEMKAYALEHPMRPGGIADMGCMREYEYSDKLTVACVLTVNPMPDIGKYGWQLSLANNDKKNELPDNVVKELVNIFFGTEHVEGGKMLELPRFPIFPVQRQFVTIKDGESDGGSEIGGG
jgi:hypothetical protein